MDYQTKETALVIKHWHDLSDNFTGVINFCNSYCWLVNKEYHREDGPAIKSYDGSKKWLINGKLHRDDGPAVIYSDGDKQWWLNGENYSQEEWFELLNPEQKEKVIWNMDNW